MMSFGLAALTNIGANVYLLPRIGITGAAIATLLAYFIMAASIYIANLKIYPIKYDAGRIVFVLIYILISFPILYLVQPGIIFRLILIAAFPVIMLISGLATKEEIAGMKNILTGNRRR